MSNIDVELQEKYNHQPTTDFLGRKLVRINKNAIDA